MVAHADPLPPVLLRELFDAAVARASAFDGISRMLPDPPAGRTYVLGAGKASAAMARAFERAWPAPLSGLVVTPYGHGCTCERIEVVEAGHPLPDEAGCAVAKRMIDVAQGAGRDDLVVFLASGGGSALLAAPAGDLSLQDEREVAIALLRSGAPISDINCVRRHVSKVKGGRLAQAAAPAHITTYVVSDIPSDDPALVASGPTFPDRTTRLNAVAVLDRFGIAAPRVRAWLATPASETPKELEEGTHHVLATAAQALAAAADLARQRGYNPIVLGDAVVGEARAVARDHAAIVRRVIAGTGVARPPCVLLSGGETTVTVLGTGRGGRNTEYALALALELGGAKGVHALAADTDGLDGTGDNAGAIVGPDTLDAAARNGIDAAAALDENDTYRAIAASDGLVVTGPTRTNVNDFRAILINPI